MGNCSRHLLTLHAHLTTQLLVGRLIAVDRHCVSESEHQHWLRAGASTWLIPVFALRANAWLLTNIDQSLQVLSRLVKLRPKLLAVPAPRRHKRRDRQFLQKLAEKARRAVGRSTTVGGAAPLIHDGRARRVSTYL